MNKLKTSWPHDLLFLLQYYLYISKMVDKTMKFVFKNLNTQLDPRLSSEQGLRELREFCSEDDRRVSGPDIFFLPIFSTSTFHFISCLKKIKSFEFEQCY